MRKLSLMLLALALVALLPPATVDAAACNWWATCGSEYGSCGSWSGTDYCDAPTCSQHERDCGDPQQGPGWGPGMVQPVERYRVCFNSSGQPCTQYEQFWVLVSCGC
jgi:hypothetical protein